MVSINTNLSSLIVQQNLTKSTNGLNQAIERLTTGYKINHASDNAAGYSIAQNMSSQLSSYDVAAENISMGIDLLNVAADTIAGMQQRGERLMSLWTQAQNGTYGAQSITAINSEANAIISEITRMYINAEYNDISLFTNNITLPDWAETVAENAGLLESAGLKESAGLTSDISASHNGFIAEAVTKSQSYVDALTHVSAVSDFDSADEFQISTVDDLVNLANLANDGVDTSGKIFYMGADLDISAYCASNSATGGWNPIGDDNVGGVFSGTFDGNGHKITGLYINREDVYGQGLFGCPTGEIKNVGLENVNVTVTGEGAWSVGGLVGLTDSSITNCYATGTVSGYDSTGILVGCSGGAITNSYATGSVTGTYSTGGLVGYTSDTITNSYATGSVTGTGTGNDTGGLAGHANGAITNSYSNSSVTGTYNVGGLVGWTESNITITNSYATGNVTGQEIVGGLAGYINLNNTITNSYATGNVTWSGSGEGEKFGGLVGGTWKGIEIKNSYATGEVSAKKYQGGLVGYLDSSSSQKSKITNCYSSSTVKGTDQYTGGLVGYALTGSTVSNSYATGGVTGTGNYTGGLAGSASTITNSYATGSVTGTGYNTGGLAGSASTITNSYATGGVTGTSNAGGLAGQASGAITNSYATGSVTGTSNAGGLAGQASGAITNSYATGNVKGTDWVGGLAGFIHHPSGTVSYNQIASYGKVSGNSCVGSLVGGISDINTGSSYATINFTNVQARSQGLDAIGGEFEYQGQGVYIPINHSIDTWNSAIEQIELPSTETTLQVGINGDTSSQVTVDTNFALNLDIADISSSGAYNTIKDFLDTLSSKATEIGAAQNRLESALESTLTSMNNLTSSLSTIRDADIAKVSSQYIKNQILQQASATLLATANQSPAFTLQLIQGLAR